MIMIQTSESVHFPPPPLPHYHPDPLPPPPRPYNSCLQLHIQCVYSAVPN